jgi:WhiB family redox-sensing transcriptional regulator
VTRAPRPGGPETEARTVQLSELVDLGSEAQQVGEPFPGRDYDAEL